MCVVSAVAAVSASCASTQRAWEPLEPWDVHPGNATIERHTVYTFQARWGETWRCGRLMIAGDAAHLMPPFAGQGMCAGLRDAMNLAWKLDLVLAGKASEDVLDSYGPERDPHVRQFIDFSMELGRLRGCRSVQRARRLPRRPAQRAAVGRGRPPGRDDLRAPQVPALLGAFGEPACCTAAITASCRRRQLTSGNAGRLFPRLDRAAAAPSAGSRT